MTKKISQLPAATSVDTNDEFVINQDGTTKKLTTANQWDFANVNIDGGTIDGTAVNATTLTAINSFALTSTGSPTAIIQSSSTSNQDAILKIRGSRTTSTDGDFCQIQFETNDEDAAGDQLAFITSGKDVASTNQGVIRFGTTRTDGGTPQEAMRIDSIGHAIIPAGVTLGTSAGVYNAANTLDDYEEGTWTPRLSGTTGGEYTIGSSNAGFYVKIGNLVTVNGTLSWDGVVTAYSGLLVISNLPFTASSTSHNRSVGAIGTGFPTGVYASGSYADLAFAIDSGNDYAYIMQKSDTITSGLNYNHIPSVNSNGNLNFSITYQV